VTGRVVLLRGDARHIPLADASVDLVLTSPPFYKLRSYTDGGAHYGSQIGSEDSPQAFIDELLECTRDWMRVLKPSGSLFVELGDTYAGAVNGPSASISASANAGRGFDGSPGQAGHARAGGGIPPGFSPKTRMLMPQRYVIGCLDRLGLTVRQEVIWHHVNETPESVTDRARTSHTVMYHLVKSRRYYASVDVIRVPAVGTAARRPGRTRTARTLVPGVQGLTFQNDSPHPLGRLPGSIWAIPSAPLNVPDWVGVDHYAAFPAELCRRVILGWSPPGICTACGQGRFPVTDKTLAAQDRGAVGSKGSKFDGGEGARRSATAGRDRLGEEYVYGSSQVRILGWACACTPYTDHPERRRPTVTPDRMYLRGDATDGLRDAAGVPGHRDWPERLPVRDYHFDRWDPAPVRPAVVLDPFGGTGTTALTAAVHGRAGVSVDMSADYCRLARWRTADPGERARALGVPKPPPVPPGQMPLFDLG